jgi:chaperonin cofactor prefoldin
MDIETRFKQLIEQQQAQIAQFNQLGQARDKLAAEINMTNGAIEELKRILDAPSAVPAGRKRRPR